ncbi:hypothetical protein HMPREF0860_2516 [Treponema socranskii subsp. socranskii VPI DR56BR1116 = ATCC 35536]|uniref:Uncharacterized protein n=1 Tax=Treponema socranskii subsp. socranskii VPI DR56BR1116 = ATCC 35536 TaxID=1125725 RepID=A0ABN0P7A8_TRESO|nr:hypothetical protein HMPREF0860_2516 [Treponema socranskii subsp. socranskii VPI DR56BR1116 = ATCC 35536]
MPGNRSSIPLSTRNNSGGKQNARQRLPNIRQILPVSAEPYPANFVCTHTKKSIAVKTLPSTALSESTFSDILKL